MESRYPAYYPRFRCLAGACPDSCCHLWEIQVDPAAARSYRSLPGALGDTLRDALYEDGGETYLSLTEGRCPMWRTDGLCRLQAELGEAALCRTCREFPRLRHDYGSFEELGLELSCPQAARLILEDPGLPLLRQEMPGGDEADYDTEAMALLLSTREEALAILSGDPPANEALALLLLRGAQVQQALDGGDLPPFHPDSALETARTFAGKGDFGAILSLFRNLEILTPQWQAMLRSPAPAPWESRHLALARYFVGRYWLQAVSDYDLYGRVKFIVTACLLIRALGGDLPRTAQLFSKEIENDPENLDTLLDAAYHSPALADTNLLAELMGGNEEL